MKDTFFESIVNKWRFEAETDLYHVEPLVPTTTCWKNLFDAENEKRGSLLDFSELKGMQLYAKLVQAQGKNYWELYIQNAKRMSTRYVKAIDLNPIKLYKR